MNLPTDPIMLLSAVNTWLRDIYSSLEELADACDADPEDIKTKLAAAGYTYNPASNQFK
ncbi:MAG: DUF4250 domain-containing protein [Lachnospiraceae bacterium]|nr:DUF4250 domain-containing protein [Lachnospiraceae bacterium]